MNPGIKSKWRLCGVCREPQITYVTPNGGVGWTCENGHDSAPFHRDSHAPSNLTRVTLSMLDRLSERELRVLELRFGKSVEQIRADLHERGEQ